MWAKVSGYPWWPAKVNRLLCRWFRMIRKNALPTKSSFSRTTACTNLHYVAPTSKPTSWPTTPAITTTSAAISASGKSCGCPSTRPTSTSNPTSPLNSRVPSAKALKSSSIGTNISSTNSKIARRGALVWFKLNYSRRAPYRTQLTYLRLR